MNIAKKIPNSRSRNVRICSKHFKEDDFQYYTTRNSQRQRKLCPNAFPVHWNDAYPDEVELVCVWFFLVIFELGLVFGQMCCAQNLCFVITSDCWGSQSFSSGDDIPGSLLRRAPKQVCSAQLKWEDCGEINHEFIWSVFQFKF